MNFITRFFKKQPNKEQLMKHFSAEYLEKLIAEHKLISATVAHLQGGAYTRMTRTHTQTITNQAISNLLTKRVELEGQIDVLTEFLQG